MEEWLKLALEISVPVIAGIVSFIVGAALLKERHARLEKDFLDAKKELIARCDRIDSKLESMPTGFRLEIGTHKDDLNDLEHRVDSLEQSKDATGDGVRMTVRGLKSEVKELREMLDRVRDSSTDFAKEAELAKVMMEMNDRFQKIQNAIGQLQGMIYNRRTDSHR